MKHTRFRPLIALLLITAIPSLSSANWPEFRGPTGDGIVPARVDGKPRGLPLEWSEDKNVVWKTPIHDQGWSTPVVWENQVWMTTATEDGRDLFAVCVDRESGKIAFDKKVFHIPNPSPLGNEVNSYASPSPVVEEGRVFVSFGSYGTACLDTNTGEVLWERQDLPCDHFRGPGSSPILYEDKLILTMDGVDFQYLVALDHKTGKTVWKTDRATDWGDYSHIKFPQEGDNVKKAYCTPLIIDVSGEARLISVGGRASYSYDPDDGSEVWRVTYNGFSNASRPVYGGGRVFLNTGYGKTSILAVRVGGEGNVTDTHMDWTFFRGVPRNPSPIFLDDLLYIVNDGGIGVCLDANTGEMIWKERIGEDHAASPIYSEGRIYFFSKEGKTTVLAPGREFKILAESRLDDGFMSSPAVVGREFYLRTKTHLYRVEDLPRNESK